MPDHEAEEIAWNEDGVILASGSSIFSVRLTWAQIRVIEPHAVFPFIRIAWNDVVEQERLMPRADVILTRLNYNKLEANFVDFLEAAEARLGERVQRSGWWARDPSPFEEIDPSRWPKKSRGGYRGAGNTETIIYKRQALPFDLALGAMFSRFQADERYHLRPTKCALTDDHLYAAGRSKKLYRAPLARLHRGRTIGHIVRKAPRPFGVFFGRRAFLHLRLLFDHKLIKALFQKI